MKICIVGQGYIGLPTAALFTTKDCDVVGVDINEDVINTLNEGKIHIEEPGLEEIIKKAVDDGKYHASLIFLYYDRLNPNRSNPPIIVTSKITPIQFIIAAIKE